MSNVRNSSFNQTASYSFRSTGGNVHMDSRFLDSLPRMARSRSVMKTRAIGGPEIDPAILTRAVRVGSPVSVDSDPGEDDRVIRKRFVREVEVPYVRQVKVPVTVDKIVSTVERKRVPTTRIVEVPSWKEVDEVYVETQEVEAFRDKEVWVKKVIKEPYIKQIEVKKTRKKKVPATEFKSVQDFVEVEVPVDKIAPSEGFRIDEVEDTKVVEVEEEETFKLQPYKTGDREIIKTREVGAIRRREGGSGHLARHVGTRVYHLEEVHDVSSDSDIDETANIAYGTRGITTTRTTTRTRGLDTYRPVSRGGDFTQSYTARSSYSARDLSSSQHIVHSMASLIGITIKNHERGGCRVIKVHHAKPAFHAGIKEGDVIVDIDNTPTLNLDDFRRAFTKTGALIHITVKRSGNLITMKVKRPVTTTVTETY